jgi:hypothetical protein
VSVRAPGLSYEDIRGRADAFLQEHHPAGQLPVPIENIVDFSLRLNVIPIPGLHADFGTDGFLSADMSEISVDLYVFESRPPRYRFTLAHEVGHLILHGDLLRAAAPNSVTDWKRFVCQLPEREREWLEWQAYCFGGLILAPREPLAAAYRNAVRVADGLGFDLSAHADAARDYIATWIAKKFEVSAAVIDKRLRYDGIFQ